MAKQSQVPQSQSPVILLTRPLAQSQRFAADLRDATGIGASVVISPLMAPAFLNAEIPAKPYHAIILTSETGAAATKALRAHLPDLAYCVGDRTAQAARDAGFTTQSGKGDAVALMALLLAQQTKGPLLHLRGADNRGDVAETLTKGGIETDSVVVYDQKPQLLSPEAAALFSQTAPLILPIFSPRSARLIQAARSQTIAPLWVAALSPAVADEARALDPARIETAHRPDAAAMLAAIQRLLAAGMGA